MKEIFSIVDMIFKAMHIGNIFEVFIFIFVFWLKFYCRSGVYMLCMYVPQVQYGHVYKFQLFFQKVNVVIRGGNTCKIAKRTTTAAVPVVQ